MPALHQHHHRRIQGREHDLEHEARADADDAAAAAAQAGADSSARISPSIFGTSSTTMLNQNSAIMSSTLNRGQVGNI